MKKNLIILLLVFYSSTCLSQIYGVGNGDGNATNCINWDFGLIVLPAELFSFDAVCSEDKIKVQWSTSSDFNNNFFTIERSTNAINFRSLVAGYTKETKNGKYYFSFTDESAPAGKTYYRLRQTGGGGQMEYSQIVSAGCNIVNKSAISIYPNPTAGLLNIKTSTPGTFLIVRNAMGRLFFQGHGISAVTTIDLSHFPQGLYYVEVQASDNSTYHKIVLNRN